MAWKTDIVVVVIGIGLAFSPYFVYNFLGEMFLVLYSIKSPNYIDYLYILRHYTLCILLLFVLQSVTS